MTTTLGDLSIAIEHAHEAYARARPISEDLHRRACDVLPGGNTRSVLHFDPFPFRVEHAEGSSLVDVDGHRYFDFLGNYTAGLFGHSPEPIRQAIESALRRGWALGAAHEIEIDLAERLCARFPSIQRVRFTNSGTEANLMAIATALHHTGRSGVMVFDGAYHGGVLAFETAGNPLNVPHRFFRTPYNDIEAAESIFSSAGPHIGCVLVEPMLGSGGCIPASVEFLETLRRVCTEHGAILVFDEVMTSRLGVGGLQAVLGITPDMTTLGKYLAGGMTFGAFGGRREIMDGFDPAAGGELRHAGTFNNNRVSMAAAVAAIDQVLTADALADVNRRGERLRLDLGDVFAKSNGQFSVTGLGSMLSIHSEDDRHLELLFHALLASGIYLARRGFLALSMETTDEQAERLTAALQQWLVASGLAGG